ncbi:hypothetical protein Tco_1269498 [Tanacetum coccineum]
MGRGKTSNHSKRKTGRKVYMGTLHMQVQSASNIKFFKVYLAVLIVLNGSQESSRVVHEDNVACIAQLKDEYIKVDKIKHILPKFFFTHDLQMSGDIIVQKVRSSDNQADLFTKALPTTTFKKFGFTKLWKCETQLT